MYGVPQSDGHCKAGSHRLHSLSQEKVINHSRVLRPDWNIGILEKWNSGMMASKKQRRQVKGQNSYCRELKKGNINVARECKFDLIFSDIPGQLFYRTMGDKFLILFHIFNLYLVSFGIIWKYLTLTGTIWAQSNKGMIGGIKK